MALPWIRLDTHFASNPKLLALISERDGYRAAFAWVCSLAYAGRHGTDGYIPEAALPFIHARRVDANRLVAHGLWIPAPGGWEINSWAEFQLSNEETQKRREKAQRAALIRWGKLDRADSATG